MSHRNRKPSCYWFVLLSVLLLAQFSPAAKSRLAVYAGTVVSNNPEFELQTLLEVPFSINRSELEFLRSDSVDGRFYSRVYAQLDIISTAGLVIDSVRTYYSVATTSLDEVTAVEMRIFNKLAIMLEPGFYSARLTVIDAVSKKRGEYYFSEVNILPSASKLALGGLTLAYNLKYVGEIGKETNPQMYKNGFEVVYNPINVVTDDDSVTYIYGEVYNLNYDQANSKSLLVTVNVLDNNKKFLSSLGSRKIQLAGQSAVISEKVDISRYRLGHYNYEIIATDLNNKNADTAYLPLHVVNQKEVLAAARDQLFAYNDPYDSLSLKVKTNLVHYLLNDNEMNVFNSLGDTGKMNFLDQYWKEHDVNPATTAIENRFELINRYNYCNKYFSNNDVKTNGWLTDRGRIFMTYGQYDEIDDVQAPRVGNAYQIWEYRSLASGGMFVFEDWSGNDDYRLIHSDVFGEVFSKAWDERIKLGDTEFLDQ